MGKVKGRSPKKIIKCRKAKGRRSGAYSTNSTKDDEMSNLVKDVQEALKGMAVSMSDLAAATKGNRGGAEQRRKKGDPDSNESSEDEDTPPVKSQKKSPAKAATAEQKYYYVVAKGRVSGVYTNWGQASKQVNGF
jgi:viroplasmin and RNaseH domain-containing protein